MKSFGRLLRQMRGTTPVEQIAQQARIDPGYLRSVESGYRVVDQIVAYELLRKVFELDDREARRTMLGIQLYDLGLRDGELRQLVIDLIRGETPRAIQEQLRKAYRRYGNSGQI